MSKWGKKVKKYMILLALAVLMLTLFPGVQGKSQNANVKNEIDGGHHNTIVTDAGQISQISQIANKNNVPYGQVKKIVREGWGNGNSGFGLSQGLGQGQGQGLGQGLSQDMNIQNQIQGGHHNTILVNGQQTASGTLANGTDNTTAGNNTAGNGSALANLSQVLNAQNQIFGGHHNMILMSSIQVAEINALGLGNVSQDANIYNQIDGGHHNIIIVGSSQQALLNSALN